MIAMMMMMMMMVMMIMMMMMMFQFLLCERRIMMRMIRGDDGDDADVDVHYPLYIFPSSSAIWSSSLQRIFWLGFLSYISVRPHLDQM